MTGRGDADATPAARIALLLKVHHHTDSKVAGSYSIGVRSGRRHVQEARVNVASIHRQDIA